MLYCCYPLKDVNVLGDIILILLGARIRFNVLIKFNIAFETCVIFVLVYQLFTYISFLKKKKYNIKVQQCFKKKKKA